MLFVPVHPNSDTSRVTSSTGSMLISCLSTSFIGDFVCFTFDFEPSYLHVSSPVYNPITCRTVLFLCFAAHVFLTLSCVRFAMCDIPTQKQDN